MSNPTTNAVPLTETEVFSLADFDPVDDTPTADQSETTIPESKEHQMPAVAEPEVKKPRAKTKKTKIKSVTKPKSKKKPRTEAKAKKTATKAKTTEVPAGQEPPAKRKRKIFTTPRGGITRVRLFKALSEVDYPDGMTTAEIRGATRISQGRGHLGTTIAQEVRRGRIRRFKGYRSTKDRADFQMNCYCLTALGKKDFADGMI